MRAAEAAAVLAPADALQHLTTAHAARAYERLGLYLLGIGRLDDALRARATAVEGNESGQ